MRSFELITVLVAALVPQTLAIQVECRQCHIVRKNEEYFERAKKVINERGDVKLVDNVSHMGIDADAMIEHATNAGKLCLLPVSRCRTTCQPLLTCVAILFVPGTIRQHMDNDNSSYSAQKIRLHESFPSYDRANM